MNFVSTLATAFSAALWVNPSTKHRVCGSFELLNHPEGRVEPKKEMHGLTVISHPPPPSILLYPCIPFGQRLACNSFGLQIVQ